jgi:hypothetical protein
MMPHKGLTFSITMLCHYAECNYAEGCILLIVKLNFLKLSVIVPLRHLTISITMLCHYPECHVVFIVMLNVIMLGAVVSLRHLTFSIQCFTIMRSVALHLLLY